MKLLLSAYACEPDRGSEYGNGWYWSLALARLGHEVWTLTSPRGRATINCQDVPPNLRIVYADTPSYVHSLLRGQFGVYAHYLLWQRTAYHVARKLDSINDFDVLHHITFGSLQGGSWLWRLGKPFVFGPVGGGQVAPPAFKKYFANAWKTEALRSIFAQRVLPYVPSRRRMLRHASLVLAANCETLALTRRMGASRGCLFLDTGLPAHCYTDPPLSPCTDGSLKVLWVGRLYPHKGLRLALEALQHTDIPFRLTILGDGPLASWVPEWIQEYGLVDCVEWRGWVPWREVQQAYRSHDVLLFTSLRDTFGSQLLEAMANNLPLITLDHHGAGDFVPEEAGFKVLVTTPAETIPRLARALGKLHADPDLRRAMGQAGGAFARTQEWARRASAITKLYESLLSTRAMSKPFKPNIARAGKGRP